MTNQFKEKETSDDIKSNLTLTRLQKIQFGMICWGVQTREQVKSFKTNGFNQKHIEAKKAIQFGLIVYAAVIITFMLWLIFINP